MAERSQAGKSAQRPGWLLTLTGLVVLAVVGFGVGLVVGVLTEEPELVMSHVTGDTTEVTWTDDGSEAALPPVAAAPIPAAPPAVKTPAPVSSKPAPLPIAPSKPVAKKASAAKPRAAKGTLAVQVGAFGESRAAESLADSLRASGFEVHVSPGTKAGDARWRVRVGPMTTREAADRIAARLKSEHKLPTWVVDEGRESL